jgi:hypothetical protein
MKRVLAVVLVVQIGMFLSGCKKKAEEPSSGAPIPSPPSPVDAVEPEEPNIGRGLVGWWKFDEAMGITAADSSGHGREGTLKGAGSLSFDSGSVEGRIGKGLNIGDSDYIEITGYKGILGTAPRTVTAWIKTKTHNGHILDWGRDEGGQMFIFGYIRDGVGVTPQGGYLYMDDKTNDDTWHHVAAVVNEAELPNLHDDVTLYRDGEVATIHRIGLLDLWPIDTPSGMDVAIGKGFEGAVDDVRIYERALSAEEIRLLFTAK